MELVLFSTLAVVLIGLFVGIFLGVASEKLKVEVDPKEEAVRAELPGNNCGGCGYPGCDGLAHAIATKEAPVDGCPVGAGTVAKAIAAIMGEEAGEKVRMSAYVRCDGTCTNAKPLYHYSGIKSCSQAKVIGSSSKACQSGCMGYGDCVKACPFDAITIDKGIAKVNKEKCKACGKCVATCPNSLIQLVPYEGIVRVMCSSTDKGAEARKLCEVSCIACGICAKQCQFEAISIINNHAQIDYDKCTKCGKCSVACPRKCIHIVK